MSPVFSSTNLEHIFDNIGKLKSLDTSFDEIGRLDKCLIAKVIEKILYSE